ncbi:MAG: hypothetical protein ABSF15_09490 [Candidatus Sulfotelmatobacter sp.]|jgi:hypothetical protein
MMPIGGFVVFLVLASGRDAWSGDPNRNAAASNPNSNKPTESTLTWARYEDRAEHSFSIEVPQGWNVQGGAYRFGYFDVRWGMDVRSSDDKNILRID